MSKPIKEWTVNWGLLAERAVSLVGLCIAVFCVLVTAISGVAVSFVIVEALGVGGPF